MIKWMIINTGLESLMSSYCRPRYESISATKFEDLYTITNEVLGAGSYGSVRTCFNNITGEVCRSRVSLLADCVARSWQDLKFFFFLNHFQEFAVKIIEKCIGHSRGRVFNEIEMYHISQGQPNILQVLPCAGRVSEGDSQIALSLVHFTQASWLGLWMVDTACKWDSQESHLRIVMENWVSLYSSLLISDIYSDYR